MVLTQNSFFLPQIVEDTNLQTNDKPKENIVDKEVL